MAASVQPAAVQTMLLVDDAKNVGLIQERELCARSLPEQKVSGLCSAIRGQIGFFESSKRLTWRAFEFQTDRGQERGHRRTLHSVYSVLKGHSETYIARTQMLHLDEFKKK